MVKIRRRIFKQGGSLVVVIPSWWCNLNNVNHGQSLEWDINKKDNKITLGIPHEKTGG